MKGLLKIVNRQASIGNIQVLLLLGIFFAGSEHSFAEEVLLRTPGLRPAEDPSIVVPFEQSYPNQPPILPEYRNASGKPARGWAGKLIKTRRFASNQSAVIYYRVSDLARSHTAGTPKNKSTALHIWPGGTILVLESYKGRVHSPESAEILAIDVLAKMNGRQGDFSSPFLPVQWSYARFTPNGTPSITPRKVNECHQCHSIAFHLTGDLVFTKFP